MGSLANSSSLQTTIQDEIRCKYSTKIVLGSPSLLTYNIYRLLSLSAFSQLSLLTLKPSPRLRLMPTTAATVMALPTAAAEPAADAYYGRYGYGLVHHAYGYGLAHHGAYYGAYAHPYAYGHYYGKRSAEAEPEADAYYGHHYGYGLAHHGYGYAHHGYYGYPYAARGYYG